MQTACKKNNGTRRKKTCTLFTSSLHILLVFKNLFIPNFPASHDKLKALVFRNNAIPLMIYLLWKVISHFQ